MKKLIILSAIFIWSIPIMIGQEFLDKQFENIIMLRPFGTMAFIDPGLEVNYYKETSNNSIWVAGYKYSSSTIDFMLQAYDNFRTHKIHAAYLFKIPLGIDYKWHYCYGPKLELSTRKHFEEYEEWVNNGEFIRLKTATLNSQGVKFIFNNELLFLSESWFVWSIGLDLGVTYRNSSSAQPDIFSYSGWLEPDIGYTSTGSYLLPHGRLRIGFGVKF